MNTRAIAAKILAGVIRDRRSLTELLQKYIPSKLSSRDQALIKEFCFGVCRWYYRLIKIADQLLYKPIKNKEAEISALLCIGLYQLIYLSIPTHAAVAETVEAAAVLKKNWAKALINQALRRFAENSATLLPKAEESLSGKFAHPSWMIEELKSAWPNDWQAILTANNEHAPLFLRVNLQKCSPQDYMTLLKKAGIEAVVVDGLPQAIRLLHPLKVQELPGFAQGYFSVQDIAGQHVIPILDLQPKHRVLDASAAPGGKTTHLLETAHFISQLIAIDNDAERLKKIAENCQRLGLNQKLLQCIAADAADTESWWDGNLFDRILLDAPCSATGVIRRHPDIKILRQAEDIEPCVKQQATLLNALWPLLKPGGYLLYTTCSIFPLENDLNIENFCLSHSDARIVPVQLQEGSAQRFGRQLLPKTDSHDGFYFSLLLKN